jgi:MFS superfamily sulfate permease-like transporter
VNAGTIIRAAIVLLVTAGLVVFKVRNIKQAIPVVVLGLVLSIALFGRRDQSEPTKLLRLKTPEDFVWLLVAVLSLVAIFLH